MNQVAQVKIVEYHEGLAKGIAKMWNESRDNWGGDSVVTTEQDVIEKEANSTNLHLFIATVGEEVVGYCGLSEYKEDQGALYIPLLNVHPAYQGLKIGKQLVLKAVEKTVELKWPRLDLFTWSGNTKAVPLYKKCGFFWEDRDNVTHLMNFIPMVRQIDLLKPFFEKHDWYTTSERIIEVKPDGIKENEHTFYEYKWTVGNEFVRVQIERTGRGIRLLETNEILIEMNLANFKLLENENHRVSYKIVNKTKNPIEISLNGQSSSLVNHHFNEVTEVTDELTYEFPVSVTMPKNDPSPWVTHPTVGAQITINGQPIQSKLGVFPIKAAKLCLRTVKNTWRPLQKGTVFLDIESLINEEATWTIKLPQSDVLEWETPEIKTSLQCKERASLPIRIKLLKNDFLNEEIEVLVERSNRPSFRFTTKLSLAFPGFGSKFGSETDEFWYGYNGPYYVEIEKRNHFVKIGSIQSKQEPHKFFTPKLGKPFSEEFSKKEATTIEYHKASEALILKTSLQSDAFFPLVLNTIYKIYGDGLIEINHELENNGKSPKDNISLMQSIQMDFRGLAIPLKDGVMIGDEATIPFMDYIRDKDISENWIFTSAHNGETKGIAWPAEAIGKKDDWKFAIEYPIGNINSEQTISLGPIQVGVNITSTWREWREFVVEEVEESVQENSFYTLQSTNSDNVTSVGKKVDYTFRSLLTPYLHGHLTVKHEGETINRLIKLDDRITEVNFQLQHQTPGVKQISGNFSSATQKGEIHSYTFVKGNKEIEIMNSEDHWSVNNGAISFSASSSYFPGIYSLTYQGKEMLDHQYPNAGPKSWWNPWGGGIRYKFKNTSHRTMQEEQTSIEPVNKYDQHGHLWSGLRLSTVFSEHETMKGVTLHQFALTLPEVPIIVLFAEIDQNAGRTFSKEVIELETFFKLGEKLSSCYVCSPQYGNFQKFYAGVEEVFLKDTPFVTIGSDDCEQKLSINHPKNRKYSVVYMNQEFLHVATESTWSASSGTAVNVEPTILLLGNESLHQFNQRLDFK